MSSSFNLTAAELGRALLKRGFVSDTFNSNNGWGFGGAAGSRYTSPDGRVIVKIATASFRHLPSSKFVTVTVNGRRLYDRPQAGADHSEALDIVDRSAPLSDEDQYVAGLGNSGDRASRIVDASGRLVE